MNVILYDCMDDAIINDDVLSQQCLAAWCSQLLSYENALVRGYGVGLVI